LIGASNYLDGKGNEVIPGLVSEQPSLHAEYAIACQRAVDASRYLKGLGIDKVSNTSSPEPTLHLKYGISCKQLYDNLNLQDQGIDIISSVDIPDPALVIRYGIACQAATSGLNYLDGKGSDVVSPGDGTPYLDGKGGDVTNHMDGKSSDVLPSLNGKGNDLTTHSGTLPEGFNPGQQSGAGFEQKKGNGSSISVMYNPEKVTIKKTVPWNTEGKGDHSSPLEEKSYESTRHPGPPPTDHIPQDSRISNRAIGSAGPEQTGAYYNPKDIDIEKNKPWGKHVTKGSSHPETEFPTGDQEPIPHSTPSPLDSSPQNQTTERHKYTRVRYVCEKCGSIMPPNMEFCGQCGGRGRPVE